MLEMYQASAWFWIVGGDESRAWSSAERGYVTAYPADGVTRIANEVELYDMMARAGLAASAPQRAFAAAEVGEALVRIDAAATGLAVTPEGA